MLPSYEEGYLKQGMTDPRVGQLQTSLNQINQGVEGWTPLAVDNIFGSKTSSALGDFQQQAGIGVDSIYGPQSFQAMQNMMAQGQSTGTPTATPAETVPTTPTDTPTDGTPTWTPPDSQPYQSPYSEQIQGILDEIINTPSYESPYAGMIQGMIEKIMNRQFDYNPETDPAFQTDSKAVSSAVMEMMNQRGILDSTVTQNQIQQEITRMAGQYRDRAYGRFIDEGNALMQQANFILGVDEAGYRRFQDERTQKSELLNFMLKMDDREFTLYRDAREQEYNRAKDMYNAEIDKINIQSKKVNDAWNRVSQLGYVDNEAALALGVQPGTLSKEARESMQRRKEQLENFAMEQKAAFERIEKQHELQLEIENIRNQRQTEIQEQQIQERTESTQNAFKSVNMLLDHFNNDIPTALEFAQSEYMKAMAGQDSWFESAEVAQTAMQILSEQQVESEQATSIITSKDVKNWLEEMRKNLISGVPDEIEQKAMIHIIYNNAGVLNNEEIGQLLQSYGLPSGQEAYEIYTAVESDPEELGKVKQIWNVIRGR